MLNQDTIQWLRRLATLAENPIITRLHELEQVTRQLDELTGWTCTGRVHWRDKDRPDKTPKMYVIHSTDQACPLHGQPEPGARLRVYVGIDEEKQEAAQAAIQAERHKRRLKERKEGLERALHRCGYHLREFYEVLGYTVPRQDQPLLYPEPREGWKSSLRW